MADGLVDLGLPLNLAQGQSWLEAAEQREDIGPEDRLFLGLVKDKLDNLETQPWRPKYSTWDRLMVLAGG